MSPPMTRDELRTEAIKIAKELGLKMSSEIRKMGVAQLREFKH